MKKYTIKPLEWHDYSDGLSRTKINDDYHLMITPVKRTNKFYAEIYGESSIFDTIEDAKKAVEEKHVESIVKWLEEVSK